MTAGTVAVAGGAGFIGGAIARKLAEAAGARVRVLSRDPERARSRFKGRGVEFVRADVLDTASLRAALKGVQAVIDAVQFEGYPIEDPRRGLTFERIDYGGAISLLQAAQTAGTLTKFVYISGAGADENSAHPAFRAKGRAERAIRESGIRFTIFRPSLVYGPGSRVIELLVKSLSWTPVFMVPGSGRQRLQPVFVGDLAAAVSLALEGCGDGETFQIGGPEAMTLDEFIRLLMEITGRRRALLHAPQSALHLLGVAAESLPVGRRVFSRDAVEFLTADSVCDNGPLLREFKLSLTPPRQGLSYLAARSA